MSSLRAKSHYEELGLNIEATASEIKSAYRLLAKKYHPDTGGNKEKFLIIQHAWEILNDPEKKKLYDRNLLVTTNHLKEEDVSFSLKNNKNHSTMSDGIIKDWIKTIYDPSNRIITQVIKPLNNEIKKLSADPYDDNLMENFSQYISESRTKIERLTSKYKSKLIPSELSKIGLDLYHCFSQVSDALDELDRYTKGYVDNYLFDGKEMMKEAKRLQTVMKENKKKYQFKN